MNLLLNKKPACTSLKSILFIINPISGGQNKLDFPDKVVRCLDLETFEPNFLFTEKIGHARELAEQAVLTDVDIIVAVGGDGTINEVASVLEGTDKIMGIIPYGSGNGLARSLNIPLDEEQAVERLNGVKVDRIDSGLFNNFKFFGIAGVGFDAHVSACFAHAPIRGFRGYIQTVLAEIWKYKSQRYVIEVDGVVFKYEAFIVSIANSQQYGNSAYVAPQGSVKDGLLDVCVVKKLPLYYLPLLAFHLFNKTAHKSKYIEIIQGKNIEIFREKAGVVHLDGEPQWMECHIQITVKPNSLAVIH